MFTEYLKGGILEDKTKEPSVDIAAELQEKEKVENKRFTNGYEKRGSKCSF